MSIGRVILVALATVVIFAAGVVTGGLLVHKTAVAAPPPPPPMMFPGRFEAIRRATEQMPDLTQAQRQRINVIIRNSQEHVADFFLLFEPDIQGVFRKMREDIRAELTQDQRRRLEELMRMRRLDGGPGFRPGEGMPPFRRPGPLRERELPAPVPGPNPDAGPTSPPPAPRQ